MGKWRNMSKKEMESRGFTVDGHCYPWVAYKGPRFQPTEIHYIATDVEADLRSKLERLPKATTP